MPIYKTKEEATKDKKIWYFMVCYVDLLGKKRRYKSKKYTTKKEAEEAEAMFRMSEKDVKESITFNDLCEDYINYISGKLKDQSVYKIKNRIRLHVIPYFGDIKINNLTKDKYISWQQQMDQTKYLPSYKNIIHGLIVSIVKHAIKYNNAMVNIPQMVGGFKDNTIKEINFFTYDEFNKFTNVIDNLEHRTLFSMLYYLGLRKGELQALTWNDVLNDNIAIKKTAVENIEGGRWIITTPKTNSSIRTVKVPLKLKVLIDELYKEKSKLKNFNNNLYVFGDFIPMCNSTMLRWKNKYCALAGVKQIRIHDFRHSTASLLISKGMDIVKVADYLGHSDKATTLNIYSHMYPDDKEKIADMIDSL